MRAEKRAQVALEFMMLAGFFLLVFTVMLAYFSSMQAREIESREYAIGKEIAALFADEIHAAAEGGEGYQKNFTIPLMLAGQYPYNITISNQSTYSAAFIGIKWAKGASQFDYALPLASRNVWWGEVKRDADDGHLVPVVGSFPVCEVVPPVAKCNRGTGNRILSRAKVIQVTNTGGKIYVFQN